MGNSCTSRQTVYDDFLTIEGKRNPAAPLEQRRSARDRALSSKYEDWADAAAEASVIRSSFAHLRRGDNDDAIHHATHSRRLSGPRPADFALPPPLLLSPAGVEGRRLQAT